MCRKSESKLRQEEREYKMTVREESEHPSTEDPFKLGQYKASAERVYLLS